MTYVIWNRVDGRYINTNCQGLRPLDDAEIFISPIEAKKGIRFYFKRIGVPGSRWSGAFLIINYREAMINEIMSA